MTKQSGTLGPVLPPPGEVSEIKRLADFVKGQRPTAFLVSPDGVRMSIPPSVYELLRTVLDLMARNEAIYLMPIHQELTTQQAAELLNVSRPHLVKLLERQELPFHKVGSHRRIRLTDLLAYKHRLDKQRREALAEMAKLSQEADLY